MKKLMAKLKQENEELYATVVKLHEESFIFYFVLHYTAVQSDSFLISIKLFFFSDTILKSKRKRKRSDKGMENIENIEHSKSTFCYPYII